MAVLGAIDIGTNALRLLVAEMEAGRGLKSLHRERRITRLGAGLDQSGRLSPPAMERTLQVLEDFSRKLAQFRANHVVAAATSAVREARNGSEFLAQVQAATGLQVEVISGEEEARRTLLGVMFDLSPRPPFSLVLDIGGGSTEFIYAEEGCPRVLLSTSLGVVRLAERHPLSDPPASQELASLRREIEAGIQAVRAAISVRALPVLIGTAGTATTLAGMDLGLDRYDPARIHLHSLTRERVREIFEQLASQTLEERRQIPFLERGREDIIVPGTAVLLLTMEGFGLDRVIVSEAGLKEGLLLHLLEKEGFHR
ncbi:MAG: Ppx/GppA family phosphatase [Candidatus Tectomicrobia bacterium]|uniref:Ppx/GppA family phosphatase n=1 Tax=Tectimicrobiota bacterium TaxID=2528274 RepID=A0A932CR90_UNCTE|nr:Ppx/GppA family phosphatase [Candidatus Tectomicrobia bacterium]